jgi:hypothetical protein
VAVWEVERRPVGCARGREEMLMRAGEPSCAPKDVFGSVPSSAWVAYGMQAGLGHAQHMQEGVVWLLASTKPG